MGETEITQSMAAYLPKVLTSIVNDYRAGWKVTETTRSKWDAQVKSLHARNQKVVVFYYGLLHAVALQEFSIGWFEVWCHTSSSITTIFSENGNFYRDRKQRTPLDIGTFTPARDPRLEPWIIQNSDSGLITVRNQGRERIVLHPDGDVELLSFSAAGLEYSRSL
jgi:hypothetical protein